METDAQCCHRYPVCTITVRWIPRATHAPPGNVPADPAGSSPCPQQPKVSREAKELVSALLVRDPSKRLGAVNGAEEIKAHPFFRDVSWPLIRNTAPPFLPQAGKKPAEAAPSIPNY